MKMTRKKTILISIEYDELEALIQKSIAAAFEKYKPNLIKSPKNIELLTRIEVLALFQIAPQTLREWVKAGVIPVPIRKGRRLYFNKLEIEKVLHKV